MCTISSSSSSSTLYTKKQYYVYKNFEKNKFNFKCYCIVFLIVHNYNLLPTFPYAMNVKARVYTCEALRSPIFYCFTKNIIIAVGPSVDFNSSFCHTANPVAIPSASTIGFYYHRTYQYYLQK